MTSGKDDSLILNSNFKVSPVMDKVIADSAAELGISRSEYMRTCVQGFGPLLLEHPVLLTFNRAELEKLAANISKILVIRPVSVEFERGGEK